MANTSPNVATPFFSSSVDPCVGTKRELNPGHVWANMPNSSATGRRVVAGGSMFPHSLVVEHRLAGGFSGVKVVSVQWNPKPYKGMESLSLHFPSGIEAVRESRVGA